MIRVRGLISSIKSSYLLNRTAFPHKVQDSWEKEFSQENAKMSYLGKLLQTNQIRPYFIEKDIKELEKEDIYFYMYNKELFHRIPRYTKQGLIKNPNASTILKFHLALQLDAYNDQSVRLHLIQSFNSSIQSLSNKDALFCLQIVNGFKEDRQEINFLQLERKFIQEEECLVFVRFVYLLSELEVKLETIPMDMVLERISQLDNLQLENILEVKRIAQFYQLQLPQPVEKRLNETFNQKRKGYTKQQSAVMVDLLPFYPHSANLLNIPSLGIEPYISFLEFFSPQQSQDSSSIPTPIQHPIPAHIIAEASITQLAIIIRRRLTLQLDTVQSLLSNIKDHYAPNLHCIIAIVRYLKKRQKMTLQAQVIIQKSILKKIINHGEKAFEQFTIIDIFRLLGYLSVHEFGTINFWKKALKFVSTSIQDPQNYKNLASQQQKKFVVYVFQIYSSKSFPRQLQDQIINLTLLSLTINRWSLKQILPLVISLKENNIADNELWFGIQQRIKKIDLRGIDFHDDRRMLKKIVTNFNLISKGSYEFWTEINNFLSKKEKLEILSVFKVPSTLAHTYFKL